MKNKKRTNSFAVEYLFPRNLDRTIKIFRKKGAALWLACRAPKERSGQNYGRCDWSKKRKIRFFLHVQYYFNLLLIKSTFDHCLYFNLAALNRKITRIWEREFGRLDLSPSHGYVLAAIAEKPGISYKGLSELMELDPSTMTRFLGKLEGKGLIPKSGKWRGASFQLTEEGRSHSRRINNLMDRLFKKSRGISEQQLFGI